MRSVERTFCGCSPLRFNVHSATISLVANNSPDEKPLETGAFVAHATRGVIRDRSARRKTMFVLLALTLFLVIAGSTFLSSLVNPREHLVTALLFWSGCVWLTITILLLALFDLTAVRRQGRRAERELQQSYSSAVGESDKLPHDQQSHDHQ